MNGTRQKKKVSPRHAATNVDALVVGGGLVGGALACALAGEGLAVAVVDTERPGRAQKSAYDGRVSAIALSSQRLLEGIGAWRALRAFATPIRHIRVAEAGTTDFLHYDSREVGGEPFGFMVENRILRRALGQRLTRLDGITLFAPARIATLARGPFGVEARLADGRLIRAPLAVAADGANSRTRAEAGIGVARRGYDQTAIVCTVRHERPHGHIAHELFLPSGPFAILPMTGRRSSLVWTETASAAPAYLALDDARFLAAIAERFGDFLGAIRLASPRWSYPLSFHLAQRFFAPRLALIGDAAHAIHPIAGQGFNLAVKDVAALAEVVAEARSQGLDPGAATALETYERWRRFDSAGLAFGTDAINRLFSTDFGPVRAARGLGLAAVNAVDPLRTLFMRQAGGDLGRLPPLMRSER